MLRNRIILGVAPLIILLMGIGSYAVWLLVRLGGAVDTTLHENYASIVAMRDLKDHALRIEQIFLASHAGGATLQQARSILDEQTSLCRRNADAELAIITEPGEREAAHELKARNEAFLGAVTTSLSQEAGTDTGIVRAHDGEIGVVAAHGGRGSEFFFTLPSTIPVEPMLPLRA